MSMTSTAQSAPNTPPQKQILSGASIFDGHIWHQDAALLLEQGRVGQCITAAESQQLCQSGDSNLQHIELDGGMLAPGFIDTQVNGGGGMLLNNARTIDDIHTIIAAHRRFGTTGMLPTLITDQSHIMTTCVTLIEQCLRQSLAGLLGYHLEGPYLNVAKKGIHRAAIIREFETDIDTLLAKQLPEMSFGRGVRMMTLAPEQQPAGTISHLTKAGVIVSAGHTQANYEQIQSAIAEGLRGFTHVFNAMSPLESRAPGVVGAALESPSTWGGLIADGHHVHPATLRIAIQTKHRSDKAGKLFLVTDAMHSVGADESSVSLFDEALYLQDGKLTNAAGTLAGSHLTMIEAVKNSVELVGLSLSEALKMASTYPATFLRLDQQLGYLRPGYQADIVHFSEDWQVKNTWIAGQHQQH